ncbi:MAG TPA: hypothetical protein VGL23_12895 [Chloroflexota bacterium]
MDRAGQPSARGPSTGRQIARYLRDLRPVLTAPRLARREWIREVGLLIDDARTGDPIALARRAGRQGREAVPIFREARRRLDDLSPPPECQALHDATGRWITLHVEACEALIRTEQQRAPRPLREVHERLVLARAQAQRFKEEYARLVEQLRAQVAAGSAREGGRDGRRPGRLRWLFRARGT